MPLTQATKGAIGLILFGAFFTLAGAASWGFCSSQPSVNGLSPSCGGPEAIAVIGVLVLLAGIGIAVSSALSGPKTIYPMTDPAVPPPLINPVLVQQTVVQQTVEVRCRYCGSLNPVTSTKCASCGASL